MKLKETLSLNRLKPDIEHNKEDIKKHFSGLKAEIMQNLDPALIDFIIKANGISEKERRKFLEESKKWDIEKLRRGGISLSENTDFLDKNGDKYFKSNILLASAYLKQVPFSSSKRGKLEFIVNFHGNELAEWNVGAAHILPPTVKKINVYDKNGNLIFENAVRQIKNGKIEGYFTADGVYARIFTGDRIEILETQDPKNYETQLRIKNEIEFHKQQADRTTILSQQFNEVPVKNFEFNPKQPFIKSTDDFGNIVILRFGAMKAFENAKRIARSIGVKLRITSSYRDYAKQAELKEKKTEKLRKFKNNNTNINKFVANPGDSAHHTGGAIDVFAYKNGVEDSNLLKLIMRRAGFVPYKAEKWHWEYGTKRWAEKTGYSLAKVYSKKFTLDKGTIFAAV